MHHPSPVLYLPSQGCDTECLPPRGPLRACLPIAKSPPFDSPSSLRSPHRLKAAPMRPLRGETPPHALLWLINTPLNMISASSSSTHLAAETNMLTDELVPIQTPPPVFRMKFLFKVGRRCVVVQTAAHRCSIRSSDPRRPSRGAAPHSHIFVQLASGKQAEP